MIHDFLEVLFHGLRCLCYRRSIARRLLEPVCGAETWLMEVVDLCKAQSDIYNLLGGGGIGATYAKLSASTCAFSTPFVLTCRSGNPPSSSPSSEPQPSTSALPYSSSGPS